MDKEKGSLIFVITLGFVIIAVIIAMVFIATNSIKEKQTTKIKIENQKEP